MLRRARAICDRYEVHLITDEIMTGFGHGDVFRAEQAGIVPDFLCLSKGITGVPAPVGRADARPDLRLAILRRCDHAEGFSIRLYAGNALRAAPRATLDILRRTA